MLRPNNTTSQFYWQHLDSPFLAALHYFIPYFQRRNRRVYPHRFLCAFVSTQPLFVLTRRNKHNHSFLTITTVLWFLHLTRNIHHLRSFGYPFYHLASLVCQRFKESSANTIWSLAQDAQKRCYTFLVVKNGHLDAPETY